MRLKTSLKLTQKPFLSLFHLIGIAGPIGTQDEPLLASANKMRPGNMLVRNRYMIGLTPRWGGSYDKMKEFIARSKKDGASAVGIMQLEAIMYDDMGLTASEHGDKPATVQNLSKALALSEKIGGVFRKEFLMTANDYSCREPELKKYCK